MPEIDDAGAKPAPRDRSAELIEAALAAAKRLEAEPVSVPQASPARPPADVFTAAALWAAADELAPPAHRQPLAASTLALPPAPAVAVQNLAVSPFSPPPPAPPAMAVRTAAARHVLPATGSRHRSPGLVDTTYSARTLGG